MEVKRVCVLGAGLMGHGIAQVCAQTGKFEVNMRDIEQRFIDNGMKMIKDSLQRFVKKGTISEAESKEILNRIHPTLDVKEAVQNVDLVIEAVTENPPLKKAVLAEADKYAPPHAVIASNTSSISITEIGAATKRAEKVCGMHFFNPPQLMRLIEIVRGLKTSDETVETIKQVSAKLGKESVLVKKDTPGFIVNRILVPALNEAVFLVAEGVADPEDIDKAITLGLNWPMGPLKLVDYVGADTHLFITDVMVNETGDPKFRPPNLLKQMVRANLLGRKTGHGFYDWTEKKQ
ncbi:MAG TPA: 3-hydroxyacyl-CoA dehydrogenase NAD-binding domain-containing protein [Candidatus Acidoferrales bacterium]|jgi:3-hydroxybutyryl-CoA dehydrogenase|nr:3-hydroxyacyl-CoA dehydrogenase NAD-binding domain-containing protein [Candidatus Acidoferrales bacterium]